MTVQGVADALGRARFTAANEDAIQQSIARILEDVAPGAFAREVSLSPRDRPDFFAAVEGIAVEVKYARSGGSDTSVLRQLSRYAEDERVRAIILATPSRRIAASMPDEIAGVPVTRVVLHTGL